MSSQIRQNYSTEVEDAIDDLASLHLQPPHLPLSGFYFNHDDEALDGVGHFLCELEKKREGSKRLLKLQNQRGGRIHSQDVLKLPKMSGQNSGRPGLGEEPEPGPLGAAGPVGSTRADPHRCDFLQNHFLGEQVKLIEKMSDHLTHFCRLAGPRLGGRVSLRKARPQAQPAAFGALCIPLAFV